MSVFVPLADGAQVELLFDLAGKTIENRLWFVNRQPPTTSAQLLALAEGVQSWHADQVMPLLASELTLLTAVATDWAAAGGVSIQSTLSSTVGGNTSGCHSANVAIKIRFKGSSAQTWRDGCNFVPGVPKDGVDQNTVGVSLADDLFDAYVNLIDLAAVFGPFPAWRWVITSMWDGGALRSDQVFARTDFIRVRVRPVAQRRKRL